MTRVVMALICIAMLAGCAGGVPKAESDVGYVHRVGWWPYQGDLEIQTFEAEVLDADLTPQNFVSLVQLRISGKMKGPLKYRPVINKVHLAEHVVHRDMEGKSLAEIHVTPVVEVVSDKEYRAELVHFSLTQELNIESMAWGGNDYLVICGPHKQDVHLVQMK